MTRAFTVSLIVLAAFQAIVPADAVCAPVAVSLLPQASVAGPDILLGDIAKISGGEAAASLRSVKLGRSPWPGASSTVNAAQVRMMLKLAGIDPASVSMSDSASTRVTRASQKVSGEDLAAAAKAAVEAAWQGVERIECDVLRDPADVTVGAGALELSSALTAALRPGMVSVPVEVRVDGQKERVISVPVRLRAMSQVVVLARAAARGQMLSPEDLTVEERDVAGSTSDLVSDIATAAGLRAKRAAPAGAVLRQSDLEVIPLVHRSGPVIIVASSGRVTVRTGGQALEDGLLGQVVKVRPEYSKESISAKVVGEGRVEIAL